MGGAIALTGKAVWADEAFSIRLAQQSLKDIIIFTARDVHPPLYYLFLKAGIFVGYQLIGMDILFVAKLVSVLPYILLLSIWGVVVKREKGIFYTGITALLLVCMPNFLNYGLEVRMYSWALLFVTVAYVYSDRIIRYNTCKDWIVFILSCLLAAYTHYFAAVAVAVIYVYLFFVCFLEFKRTLCAIWGGIAVILYSPWIVVLFNQMQTVKDSYWIQSLKFEDIKGFLYYAIAPPIGILHADEFAIGLTGVIVAVGVVKMVIGIRNNKYTSGIAYALLGCIVTFLTVLFGIGVSVLYKPVFVNRYMFPALGCFWIGIGGIILKIRRKKLCYLFLILFIPCCMLNLLSFAKTENRYSKEYARIDEILKNIEDKDLIVSNSAQVMYSLEIYLENEGLIWKNKENLIYKQIFPKINSVEQNFEEEDLSHIKWVVQSKGNNELVEQLDEQGVNCIQVGDYSLKWMNFSIYKVYD